MAPRDRKQHARTGLLANFLMMAGSGYFEMLTGLVRSVVVMRYLGPTARGLMGLVQTIEAYLSNSHLGVLHGISKRLPAAIGAGDEEEAQEVEDSGVSWNLLTASVASAGILLAALFTPGLTSLTRTVLILGAFIYLSDQLYNLYRTVARAWQVYQPLVVSSVVLAITLTLFQIFGAWKGQLNGVMIGWLAATIIATTVQYIGVRVVIRMRLNWSMVKSLLWAGLPLAAMAIGDTLLTLVDSTLLLRRGAIGAFGLYMGIAVQTRRYMFNIVRNVSFVLLPHLLEEFAKTRSVERLRQVALQPTAALAISVPFLSALTAVFLPAAARTLVPRYVAAVPAGQIVAFGTCIMTLPIAMSNTLIVLDRGWEAFAGQLVGALAIVCFAWAPAGHADLVGTAKAFCIGAWCMTVTLSLTAMYRLEIGFGRSVLSLLAFQVPLAWAFASWMASKWIAHSLRAPADDTWPGAVFRFALMLTLMLPLVVYTFQRFGILPRLRQLAAHLRDRRKGDTSGPEPE